MKTKLISILLLMSLTSCASMRRHPLLYGTVIGGATGTAIALATRQAPCPSINGYQGTPGPHGYCPEYWPEPNHTKRAAHK